LRSVFIASACGAVVLTQLGARFRPAASAAGADDVQAVIARDNACAQATVDHEVELFADCLATGFVEEYIQPATSTQPAQWKTVKRDDWVEGVRKGTDKYDYVHLRDQEVHIQGDIATLTGSYSQKATSNGKDNSADGMYVETWIKQQGHWRLINGIFP